MPTPEAASVRDGDSPSARVTFEEYTYWAKITRGEEEVKARQSTLDVATAGAVTGGADEKHKEASVQQSEAEAPKAADAAAPQEEEGSVQVERGRPRTTGWIAVFFLITTDILGPMSTPWAFAQTGYGPGVALFTVFGALAAYSGYILWDLYLGLDSDRYPLLTLGDVFDRLFGAVPRRLMNGMLALQMLLFVSHVILESGQGISQISQGAEGNRGDGLCFIVCMLLYAVVGLAVSQIKSLRGVAWLSNAAVLGVVVYYPPNFKATQASYGAAFGPGPIRTFAGSPPAGLASGGTGFVAALNGLNMAVYAYGGCMAFIAFLAEMRHPLEFWKSLLCGQVFIYALYLFFGMFIYAHQGQFAFNPVMQGLSPYGFQTATNVMFLFSGLIASTLYSNVGFKSVYSDLFEGPLGFPPLNGGRRGRLAWAACMLLFWGIAFVLAAAVPHLSFVTGFVGALLILTLTYTAPAVVSLAFRLQSDALAEGEASFDPTTRRAVARVDAGWARYWRAYKKRPWLNSFNVLYAVGGLVTTGLGVYSSVNGLIAAFGGKSVATSFGCKPPV
ncbi:Transmembrane amino acid transporter family protein [Cordyceps fumosorosea ARSEF 2679]|uniref:Transmembrane amino acid transporter family protein n=1 Tax=Cordyceps fumosorosea (strain ARSEF 2679) TaxID=1081104 RepID=A0A167NZI4_CORFA|nr:Transmembrane amino acid transporter family protein [Cordyceps fumosorosea ARSEF 2679]OAA56116.1 Transmembrane amino acid transporter family protein [Cordyceps fumosorosea ARSEF 2679]